MTRIDDTIKFIRTANTLIIVRVPDYTAPVIMAFAFLFSIAFKPILSFIPLLIFIYLILHHSKMYIDIVNKHVYSAHFLHKLTICKTQIVKFHDINKILVKGRYSHSDKEPSLYKTFRYDYYLCLNTQQIDLGLSIQSISTVHHINDLIQHAGLSVQIEIDETDIKDKQ